MERALLFLDALWMSKFTWPLKLSTLSEVTFKKKETDFLESRAYARVCMHVCVLVCVYVYVPAGNV